MNKELFGIGRGYLFGFGVMIMTGIIIIVVIMKDAGQANFLLGYWGELAKWLTMTVLGAKGLEKIGTTFGQAQIKKHENGSTK